MRAGVGVVWLAGWLEVADDAQFWGWGPRRGMRTMLLVVVVGVGCVWGGSGGGGGEASVVGILYRGNSKTRIRRHELDG